MKTRNGFVSNSSSSSFIVAFPHKPIDAADVWKFMFDGKEGAISHYENEPFSYSTISSIVFQDLLKNNLKAAKLADIVEQFSGRYNYHANVSHSFWEGRRVDVRGGSWFEPLHRYFGSDPELMEKIAQQEISHQARSNKFQSKMKKIESASGIISPDLRAYRGGIDYKTNTPYTVEQVVATEKYYKELEEFRKTSEKYIKVSNACKKAYQKDFKERNRLFDKMANIDAKNFLKDNKGKFIFIVEYCDNEGDTGSTMEHGSVFENVPHVKISHH